MQNFFNSIFIGLASIVGAIHGFFAPPQNLASTNPIETPVALFSTTLANSITSSATTMTLTSATTKNGTALASSTYSFIIDEGTASEEFVKADCTSTVCTNMDRGLSVTTGTTTVAILQKSHRRGASVKITDAPILLNLTRIVNGIGTFPNHVSYTNHTTFNNDTDLVDRKFVTDTAFGTTPVVVSAGGTGNVTLPLNALLVGNGTSPVTSTTSPTVGYITATAANATSSFAGGISVTGATSTFSGAQITGTGHGIIFPDSTLQTTAGSPIKFGGDGSDGALSVSSGTTNIDLGSAAVFTKNYSSISITGTGAVTFSNPNAAGTIIVLRSQGNVVLTSSATQLIDISGLGADGTSALTSTSFLPPGKAAVGGTGQSGSSDGPGGPGGTPGTLGYLTTNSTQLESKSILFTVGGGGSQGGTGQTGSGTGGAGGKGGGALYIEVARDLNFTGTIKGVGSAGTNGQAAQSGIGGGGGGGAGGNGGNVVILYNTLTSSAGTITLTGGAPGTGGANRSNSNTTNSGGGGGGSTSGTSTTGVTGSTGIAATGSATGAGGAGATGVTGTSLVLLNKWFN